MQGIAVGVGEHRHGPKAHAFGRADDPARDLAAVGDQELVEAPGERHRHILKMPKRVGSGGGALSPAASASASTVRVSAGSMVPSAQTRALAEEGWACSFDWARVGGLEGSACGAPPLAA